METTKRLFSLCLLLGLLVGSIAAQDGRPRITIFEADATEIGRDALENRTARVRVRWATAARPHDGHLLFDQVLPDGSVINVELPRRSMAVPSSGAGDVAPILPDATSETIVLRLAMIDTASNRVLDEVQVTIAIVAGVAGSSEDDVRPVIRTFQAESDAGVSVNALETDTARLTVSWSVGNRPESANLVFEQVFTDGRVINVELPREIAEVPSSGEGIVAPLLPGTGETMLTLRLRLVDTASGRTYDQRQIQVAILPPARFTRFSTTTTYVSREAIQGGRTLDVQWNLINRPDDTNLVFEQVLPDGTVRNAELPREVLLVPSSGSGRLAPILPDGEPSELVFRVRLVPLDSSATLAEETLRVPVLSAEPTDDRGNPIVRGDTCYAPPFPPYRGLRVGAPGRILTLDEGTMLPLFANDGNNTSAIAQLGPGTEFDIVAGPTCIRETGDSGVTWRYWLIQTLDGGIRGWVTEYETTSTGEISRWLIESPAGQANPVEIVSFTVSPEAIPVSALETAIITVAWETRNAAQVALVAGGVEVVVPDAPQGQLTFALSELTIDQNPVEVVLLARDGEGNSASASRPVRIETQVSINDFRINPEPPTANQVVTLAWDISGDFSRAGIEWTPTGRDAARIVSITRGRGTFDFRLPEDVGGDMVFRLYVEDEIGARQTAFVRSTIRCAFEWDFDVTTTQCPESPAIDSTGTYQPFERGFMIWSPGPGDSVYVFINGGMALTFPNPWDGQEYVIAESPPDGFLIPVQGFGYVWNTTPMVRSGLGWATGQETAYAVRRQSSLITARHEPRLTFVNTPTGRVLEVAITLHQTTTWRFLN